MLPSRLMRIILPIRLNLSCAASRYSKPSPVVMTSANRAGEAPATDAGAVRQTFADGELAAVLDGGPCALGEASTVARLGPGGIELLREGIVTMEEIKRTAGQRLLFVCTGNTCRSPMAEALARTALRRALEAKDEADFGFRVGSAGVYAGPGAPASPQAIEALAERDIPSGITAPHRPLRRSSLTRTASTA